MFMMTNAVSTMTWSVFHVYFQPSNDANIISTSSSSSILAAILDKRSSLSRVTTVVTPSATTSDSSHLNDAQSNVAAVPITSSFSSSSSYTPLLKPLNASMQRLLYKRIEDHFATRKRPVPLAPYQNAGTCQHRNVVQISQNHSAIDYVACCGLGHRLGRMSAAALVATRLKAHLYGYWGCCDEVEVFAHLFGNEPIVLYDEEDEDKQGGNSDPVDRTNLSQRKASSSTALLRGNATATHAPMHLQFRNEVAGFGGRHNKCEVTNEKVQSDFAFFSTLRERYTNKHVVDKFVQQHFTNQTLSIAIHIRAGNGETGDFANKKRQINDPAAFVRNTANMIREIVAQNSNTSSSSSSSSSSQQLLSPLVFIATDTRSYVDAFRKELASSSSSSSGEDGSSTSSIPVVTLPAQVHAAEGQGVMFGVANQVTQSGEKCIDGWRNVVEDMLVLSHADIVFAPSYSSFTQTIPISLALGRRKDAHGENKSHMTPFCDVTSDGKLSCHETFQQWHCNAHPRANTHKDVEEIWHDVLLPVS
jgi:hypothetical protein